MKILFDQCTPAPLRRHLSGHLVHTAAELGWSAISNGALLLRAEEEGYELFITTDQRMEYQQNLIGKRLAVIVLLSNRWTLVRDRTEEIAEAVNGIGPGQLRHIPIPSGDSR